MAYSEFNLEGVVETFALTLDTSRDLFADVPPVAATSSVAEQIRQNMPLALSMNTEKARSEFLIAPVIGEVWRLAEYRVACYSGAAFTVDEAAGLSGVADYLMTRGPQVPVVSAPVVVVVEGKKENISGGYGQCAAELVAAVRLNRRQKTGVETVVGAVTIGDNWRFLRLSGPELAIDRVEYMIADLPKILGILLHAVGEHPAEKAKP